MKRPGKIRGLDEIYFNYNSIYGVYESLWLSSTWPIKVLMHGTLTHYRGELVLKTSAQFEIENGVIEYVKGELKMKADEKNIFERTTHIKTSKDTEDHWMYWMKESVIKVK